METREMIETLNKMLEAVKQSERAERLIKRMYDDAKLYKELMNDSNRSEQERLYWNSRYDLIQNYLFALRS